MMRDTKRPLFPEPIRPVLSGCPVGPIARCILALMCLILVSGFLTALSLEPDPRGFGTHQRLGLPPCSFRMFFGIHCPTCGMTTSFAHFVRLDLTGSFKAHRVGPFLAGFCLMMVPWSALSAVTGRTWKVETPDKAVVYTLAVTCVLLAIAWGIQLMR